MEKIDAATIGAKGFLPEAIILADGDYPSHHIPCSMLDNAQFIACCDGAVNEFTSRGGTPSIIIGDGDSISEENRNKYASIIIKINEQENNDLTKTVKHLKALGLTRIAILGATGKREDHTLGNISLLIEYMKMGMDVRMITDHGTFIPACGDCSFQSFNRQQVSIFNFGASGMSAEGLQYPLSDFTNWWQGTLNQSNGNSFTIHAKGYYMVFITHEAKP